MAAPNHTIDESGVRSQNICGDRETKLWGQLWQIDELRQLSQTAMFALARLGSIANQPRNRSHSGRDPSDFWRLKVLAQWVGNVSYSRWE